MFTSNNKQILALFNKLDETSEFEVMFNNYKQTNKLSIINFMNVLNYVKYRSIKENLNLISNSSLDIAYRVSTNNSYRVSINGLQNINNILNTIHQRKNHIICSLLATQYAKTEGIKFINKINDRKTMIDIDQHDIRIRLSSEMPMTKEDMDIFANIQYTESENINFRYKQRVSLVLSKEHNIMADLTFIKSASNPNLLSQSPLTYEIEIDYSPQALKDTKYKTIPNEKILDMILNEVDKFKQVLDNTNMIISKEESDSVISQYKKLSYGYETHTSTQIYYMKAISADVQHIIDKIPNHYSVSDKADGLHYILFIIKGIVYLISGNLGVRKTKYIIDGMDMTIIEGELIHLPKENKYLFMMFDCLYFNGKDIRNEALLENRLKYIYQFTSQINKSYQVKKYTEAFDLKKQETHYMKELVNFYSHINSMIDKMQINDILFHCKFFLFPSGGSNSEVYSFSYLIWDGCTNKKEVNCKYMLDGIIFTGVNQKYTADKRDHKYPIYKYKPPTTNSLDVYVTFVRNIETNTYTDIYDNTVGLAENAVFRVVSFFVGDSVGNVEVPVPFMKEENNHEAYFPLDRGEIRDVEGNLVNDNTVIEIIYENNSAIPHPYRWKILRTRWDKTESVIRHKKNYGNYKDTAEKVWKSMCESVTIDEICKLAKSENYISQQKQLKLRIDTKVISSERGQDKYYQKISNLIKPMKKFHNWLKTNIIQTYCSEGRENIDGKKYRKTILELGIGRGGDIMKYYHARVQECVGIEPNFSNLFSALDSAMVRYNKNKKMFPQFPKHTFIQGNAKIPLVADLQEKSLTNMTPENKQNISMIFNNKRQFDVISIMFAIHYLFETQQTVDDLMHTIKTYLKKDGYMICTLFDANRVMKLLNGKESYTSYYTNDEGHRNKLFEIIKRFKGDVKDVPGQPIDVHMDWISEEDSYETEYLITPKLLINSMKQADCELVETDLFLNSYNINRDWITQVIKYEHNPKNKKQYDEVAAFYGDLQNADKESKIWNELMRFYVFKKVNKF
jgi:hypothetical protein